MAKNIEKSLEEAYKKRTKLEISKADILEQIKNANELIKELEKEKKKINGEIVLKKIEAKGFSLDDILKIMEKDKVTSEEGGEGNV